MGDLRVEECIDEQLRRYVRTARLVDPLSVAKPIAQRQLMDVTLVAMSPQAFTLTGFERENGAEYAQSWLIAEAR